MITFEELGMSNHLLSAIKHLGFETPTQIQEEAIPLILNGIDVIGESATGSGKTLAFGCGVVEHISPGNGLQGIILTPTRELAQQVKKSIQDLAQDKKLHVTEVYGGVAMGPQIKALKTAEVVIATPGRFLDHMRQGNINTENVHLFVLDEADRMLDMGFIDDVEKIIKACPEDKQNLFFSATVSGKINDLAQHYMYKPVKVSAVKQVDPSLLKQVYYDVDRNMKLSLLVHLLKEDKTEGLSIVFCNTRHTTDFVFKTLKEQGINATAIHGGLSQNKREKTLDIFKEKAAVLVCTDVAARGLHIDNVTHVYNYEVPKDKRDYVHRIGRTARAGEEGLVVNLIADADHMNFNAVMRQYRNFNIPRQETPHLKHIHATRPPRDFSRGGPRRGGPRGHRGGPRGGPRNGSRGRRGPPRQGRRPRSF